jgi:hypothetical protein
LADGGVIFRVRAHPGDVGTASGGVIA